MNRQHDSPTVFVVDDDAAVRARGGEITSVGAQRLRGARLRVALPLEAPGEST